MTDKLFDFLGIDHPIAVFFVTIALVAGGLWCVKFMLDLLVRFFAWNRDRRKRKA